MPSKGHIGGIRGWKLLKEGNTTPDNWFLSFEEQNKYPYLKTVSIGCSWNSSSVTVFLENLINWIRLEMVFFLDAILIKKKKKRENELVKISVGDA